MHRDGAEISTDRGGCFLCLGQCLSMQMGSLFFFFAMKCLFCMVILLKQGHFRGTVWRKGLHIVNDIIVTSRTNKLLTFLLLEEEGRLKMCLKAARFSFIIGFPTEQIKAKWE